MRALLIALVWLPAIAVAQTQNPDPLAPPGEQPAARPADPAKPAEPAKPAGPAKPPEKDQVYKWTDEHGVVHYTSKPPTDTAKPAKLPPIQIYKPGTPADLNRYQPPAAPAKPEAPAFQIELVTPKPDETFHGGERVVPIAVLVTPQLTGNQKLVYELDGERKSEPTTDTSYSFTEVERGTHTAAVAVVDASGAEPTELSKSEPVTFHMKPPGLNSPARRKK